MFSIYKQLASCFLPPYPERFCPKYLNVCTLPANRLLKLLYWLHVTASPTYSDLLLFPTPLLSHSYDKISGYPAFCARHLPAATRLLSTPSTMLAARLLRSVTATPRVAIPRFTVSRIALGRRSYAAAAATPQNIKPPIQLFGVDGTYASALVLSFLLLLPSLSPYLPSAQD